MIMDNLITAFYDLLVAISGLSEFIKSFFRVLGVTQSVIPPEAIEISKNFRKKNEKFYLLKDFEILEYYFRLAFGSIFDGDSFERN